MPVSRSRRLILAVLLGAVLAAAATTASREAALGAEGRAGPFDGRWKATVTPAQLRRAGASASLTARLYGPYTAVFRSGRLETHNGRTGAIATGTFSVRGKVTRVVFESGVAVKPGQVSECTWSVYRDRLTFKAIPGRPSLLCDAPVWTRGG